MNPTDHPDLTAYALGELHDEHAEAMARWTAHNDRARAEADAIAELGRHLESTAPAPKLRLHEHQRAAIFTGPQKVRQMVAAASQASRKPRSRVVPILFTVGKFAAAAGLMIGGFVAGTHFQTAPSTTAAASQSPGIKPSAAPSTGTTVAPFRAQEITPVVAKVEPPPSQVAPAAVVLAKVETPEPKKAEPVVVVASLPADAKATEAAKPQPALAHTKMLDLAFRDTNKGAQSATRFATAETRFHAPKSATVVSAAPMTNAPKAAEAQKPRAPEPLRVHTWKAEVASCPWNPANRLVRVTLQVPGEQAASASGEVFSLNVAFEPNYVRNYRKVCQRTIPAQAADGPAFHSVWYEFQPNGGTSRDGNGRIVASVSVPNMLFTSPASGPFDSSKLQIVDRGTSWDAARDDFIFESAVAGFGLLLKGEGAPGKLDHDLVLSLVDRSLKDDRSGERARFHKLVKDASRAAGL